MKRNRQGFTLLELALVVLFMGLFFSMLMGMKMQTDKIARMASDPSKKKKDVYKIFNHILDAFTNTFYLVLMLKAKNPEFSFRVEFLKGEIPMVSPR